MSSLTEQVLAREAAAREAKVAEAKVAYRDLLNAAAAGPLDPDDLARLTEVLGVLGLTTAIADADVRALVRDATYSAQLEEMTDPCVEAERTLARLVKPLAEASAKWGALRAEQTVAEEVIRAKQKVIDKVKEHRRQHPRLFG